MIKTLIQLKKLNDSYLPGKIKNSPGEKKRKSPRGDIQTVCEHHKICESYKAYGYPYCYTHCTEGFNYEFVAT